MSFARNRGLFGEPLEGVGALGCRPLGCGGPTVRLPCSFSGDSPSFQCPHSPSQLLPVFHRGIGSECCGSGPFCEWSDRTCSSFSRLLQPPVCYPQGHRGLTAGDRPLLSQLLCSSHPFPYGDSTVGPPISVSRGLDGVSRSSGHLPSGSCPSGVSLLPEVLRRGRGLPVSRSLLRPFDRAASIHSRHGPNFAIMHCHGFRILRYLDDWLVLGSSFQDLVQARDFLLWLCQELGVLVNLEKSSPTPTQTLDYLEKRLQTLPLRVFPTPQTCPEARISRLRIRFLSSAATVSLASAVRGDVVDHSGVSSPVSSAMTELRQPSSSELGQRFQRIFGGGPSSPIFSSSFHWGSPIPAFRSSRTPRIPVETRCPTRGL